MTERFPFTSKETIQHHKVYDKNTNAEEAEVEQF